MQHYLLGELDVTDFMEIAESVWDDLGDSPLVKAAVQAEYCGIYELMLSFCSNCREVYADLDIGSLKILESFLIKKEITHVIAVYPSGIFYIRRNNTIPMLSLYRVEIRH